jgi:aspartate aminotransferase
MPHCGGLIGRKRPDGRVIGSSTDLAGYFLDAGIVVVPGAGFFRDPYFRISVATSDDNIREGIRRTEAACAALS